MDGDEVMDLSAIEQLLIERRAMYELFVSHGISSNPHSGAMPLVVAGEALLSEIRRLKKLLHTGSELARLREMYE